MGTADKHIRVSEEHYERLKRLMREGESFDDVVGRLLADERDLLAGFGSIDRRGGVGMAKAHEADEEKSTRRARRFAGTDEQRDDEGVDP